MLRFIAGIALLVPAAIAAQSMPPAQVISAQRLKQLGDSLTPGGGKSVQLGRGSNYTYTIWHRDSSSATLERHDAWADIVIVESGSATMLTGGVQEGATETSPGEWRGGTSRAATKQVIKAGDIVTTPAGTPHQMLLAPGERITYITIKVAAQPRG